jgi:hypothetical protein
VLHDDVESRTYGIDSEGRGPSAINPNRALNRFARVAGHGGRIPGMNQVKSWDVIYLNKRGSNLDNDWVYYRFRSDGGGDNDPITVCQVKWPTFEDIDLIGDEKKAVITSPGLTGLVTAYEQTCLLMKNQWGIEQADSIVIGSLIKEA